MRVLAPLTSEDPPLVAGYRLTHRLGEGGMGKVYLSHTPGGRPIAIKVVRSELASDPDFRRRFQQEVRAAQRVQGLYTAPVIDSDTEGPRPWLATAYVAGPSLHAAIREHGPLPVPAAARTLAGIAEALQVIHGAGVIHRDLKPSNVLLASDGPRVIDFGIARATDATALTRSGVTAGTPAFMAPEQAMGQSLTPAVDIFALGQIAVFITAGMPPFGDGSSPAVLYRIVHEEPNLSGVPDELRALVARCLAKDPAERPSPAEVIEACRPLGPNVPPDEGGWLPPAVTAEIDNQAATVTAGATQPSPPPAAPPPAPGGFGPAPGSYPSHPTGPFPAYPATGQQPRRRGRTVVLVTASVFAVLIALGIVGRLLGFGDDADGGDQAGGDVSQAPTTSEDPAGEDGQDPQNQEPTTEPPADPEPVTHPGIQIPGGYIVHLYDDPPTPQDAELGAGYEGDFGLYYDSLFGDYRLQTGEEGNTLVLLETREEGTLDTCRSVSRYTDSIDREAAPPGSQICVTTATGDIGLVTVVDYAPDDSPSAYVTVDITVWRGAAQTG
ncbi:serine/threonine-protein kinase [Streptomyces specialis]|uniref:serine/threonine-protein kinase n=1 Tax=Streptomyces specialis TaxID=498367 RepID=UPI00073EFA57|nr:serine/threonine-protein kinase [Streptomyces specialis]